MRPEDVAGPSGATRTTRRNVAEGKYPPKRGTLQSEDGGGRTRRVLANRTLLEFFRSEQTGGRLSHVTVYESSESQEVKVPTQGLKEVWLWLTSNAGTAPPLSKTFIRSTPSTTCTTRRSVRSTTSSWTRTTARS